MNDNRKAEGRLDKFARNLCSDGALAIVDGLPALLRHDTLEQLENDALEAADNYGRAIEVLSAFDMAGDFDIEGASTVIRREYLARKSLQAYQAEIALRQREAGAGVH